MNEFKCKCVKCGVEKSYFDMKEAYMDGFNFGKNAMCWECQKSLKNTTPEFEPFNEIVIE